jgi:hypothetical protein
MTVCSPLPASNVREIPRFEVMSSTDWATPRVVPFTPNAFVDISDYFRIKLQASSFSGVCY